MCWSLLWFDPGTWRCRQSFGVGVKPAGSYKRGGLGTMEEGVWYYMIGGESRVVRVHWRMCSDDKYREARRTDKMRQRKISVEYHGSKQKIIAKESVHVYLTLTDPLPVL